MLVKEAMTPNPIVVDPTATLPEVRELMRTRRIRRVPGVKKGRLVGISPDRDIMSAMPSPATTLSKWGMNTLRDQLTAQEFMTSSDIFRAFVDVLSGGDIPGVRFELRVEHDRGILSQLAHFGNDGGGSVISRAALNEPDGKRKRVLVKEEGTDAERVRAILEEAHIEVLDVRERGRCTFPAVGM
ncbi:MAG: CBS domain-containing protein [Chloroflexi bacterium]|nr:MAG: CBS domain-containing protein [Chloroflexota bacterium]